ncbi:hypothetical protein PVK06_047892 [Gossypium arboreum]|uniref:Uncharacterized protein n=1 Tax=Gossypium arboreum TaxID=29729 RepID=A0ABR0MEL3_GOSAR|nr:hypothetical protein PVK06_047892 [Gossypium arboreum]
MVEGTPMGTQILKMIGYIESLEKLGSPLGEELAIDVILQFLLESFSQFVEPQSIIMVHNDKGKGKPKVKENPKDNGKAKPNKGKDA